MKTRSLTLLLFVFSTIFTIEITSAQESTDLALNFRNSKTSTNLAMDLRNSKTSTNIEMNAKNTNTTTKVVYSKAPNRKLANKDLWHRISEQRFECPFLRLAVEYSDNKYILIEMDENKRILASDTNYATIEKEINKLTLSF